MTSPAHSIFSNPDFMRGMTYAGFHPDVFSSTESDHAVANMQSAGITDVAVAAGWWQEDQRSTQIRPFVEKSASDQSLRHLIRLLKTHNIRVLLKPFVDSRDGTWRAEFKPKKRKDWFASYEEFILYFARLAEEEKVEVLSLGCENILGNVIQQRFWKRIIRTVRKEYSGKLTYSSNFHGATSYRKVKFWELLDYISINAYFKITDSVNASTDELVQGWQEHIHDIQKWHQRRYSNIPVLFTEIGVCSSKGACRHPWQYHQLDTASQVEQANYYKAFFRAFSDKSWLHGVFWWWWDNPSTQDYINGGEDYATYYTPHGKQAEEVLKSWYLPKQGPVV